MTGIGLVQRRGMEVSFAAGIVLILTILFLPIPKFIIDMGLAISDRDFGTGS